MASDTAALFAPASIRGTSGDDAELFQIEGKQMSSSPVLMFWLLVAPLVYGLVDVVKTYSAVKAGRAANSPSGSWSAALHLKGK